ncbi:hypothetical protein NL676_034509 [Syzygium grande]|nr:hypothetical protein NL676_034509 [Syzygium grande]
MQKQRNTKICMLCFNSFLAFVQKIWLIFHRILWKPMEQAYLSHSSDIFGAAEYFSLLSHMLEVYPEMVGQLNNEAFSHILETLEFGLHHQ